MSYGYSNRFAGFGQPVARDEARSRVAFLRKVYGLFFGGVMVATVGALVALNLGAESSRLVVGGGVARVPPLVAWVAQHFIISLIVYFGAGFAVNAVRRTPGVNIAALFGFTFISGVYIAPLLFLAGVLASGGQTLSGNPVRDAFLLSSAAFGGLTGYAVITKRDF